MYGERAPIVSDLHPAAGPVTHILGLELRTDDRLQEGEVLVYGADDQVIGMLTLGH